MPMVTRYRVETTCGLYLTDCNEFTHDIDDAVQFRTEDAACQEADRHPGSMVERFERYAAFPDLVFSVPASTVFQERRSA